ncbi:MAG TPA: hypothetical protein VHY48_10720 [Acidobacteriaceae bacterium]|jgi:hypothetical protein|nr:hypothetical protein [Acidobacteriaceae bacterium]
MADSNDSPSYTRGPLVATVIAVIVIVAAAVAIFLFNPRKTADLSVSKVVLFAPHTETQAVQGSMHVLGEAGSVEDDLYVIAHIRITDHLRIPFYMGDWTGLLKLADGHIVDATTVPARELPRLEQIFPALTPLVSNPLSFDDRVDAGATHEGDVILLFPNITEDQWKSRQAAVLTIDLRDQNPQTVTLP